MISGLLDHKYYTPARSTIQWRRAPVPTLTNEHETKELKTPSILRILSEEAVTKRRQFNVESVDTL